MTVQERIDAIKENGGQYLQRFKLENITYSMCLEAVSLDGTALYFVPAEYRTDEIYGIACKTAGQLLYDVPPESITLSICRDAVRSYGAALEYVPQEYLIEDICFEAVCNDPHAFRFVPEGILTPEFCAKVISKKDGSWISSLPDSYKKTSFFSALIDLAPKVFWYLPKKNRTAAICKKAIRNMGFNSTSEAVHRIPQLFGKLHPALYDHETCLEFATSEYFINWTEMRQGRGTLSSIIGNELTIKDDVIQLDKFLCFYDVCVEAVQANRFFIQAVPQEMMSEELCERAIMADGYCFRYIPDQYKTQKICELAVAYDPHNLEEIPDDYKTPSMCLTAVKASGFNLSAVPEALKTHEMCVIAVSDNSSGLDYVPEHLFDKEIALLAINNPPTYGPLRLSRIPENLRDYEVCEAAVSKTGSNLAYVPENVKDYNLCLIAAQHGFYAAKYIPYEYFTPELCLVVAKGNSSDFKWIPKDRLTKEACLEAVKHRTMAGGTVIGEIPHEILTPEMCDISVKTAVQSFSQIPEEYITEEILLYVAEKAPGLLQENFPLRFRTKECIEMFIEKCPSATSFFRRLIGD